MFDIGWQELFIIAVVALVVIGPKDLPHVIRAVMRFSRRMRGIAGEFQSTLAEVAREAELDEIRRKVEAAARADPAAAIKKSVDPTGALTADFDPAEFNRQLMDRIEAGPPSGPRPSAPAALPPDAAADTPAGEGPGAGASDTPDATPGERALPLPDATPAERQGRDPGRQG